MAMYVSLIKFTNQGIHNIKDTLKRHEAAMVEAEKMGMKIIEPFWTMGASPRRGGVARRAQRRNHDCVRP